MSVTLNIRPDEEDVGRDGIGGGSEEEDDDIVDVEEEVCAGVSTPTRFDQYFRFCLKWGFHYELLAASSNQQHRNYL